MKFATRIRKFDINITMTNCDACHLPESILKGMLPPFNAFCFDRIETSNLADYITVPRILNDWGPLINRQNRSSTLLIYLMNWQGNEPELDSISAMGREFISKYSSIIVSLFDTLTESFCKN